MTRSIARFKFEYKYFRLSLQKLVSVGTDDVILGTRSTGSYTHTILCWKNICYCRLEHTISFIISKGWIKNPFSLVEVLLHVMLIIFF